MEPRPYYHRFAWVYDLLQSQPRWVTPTRKLPRSLPRLGYWRSTTVCLMRGELFYPTLEALVARFPQQADFIRAFDARWIELLGGAIDANVNIMQALKRKGVPIHAISNYNREKFDIARTLFPFLNEFDELVLSGDVGLVKPDAAIFELLIRRCNLDVCRTVFIDDSADNVATADRLGFATIHFNERTTNLRAELLRLGLPHDLRDRQR